MFGYISINKPELKVRELNEYQSFYCGVCRSLGKQSGVFAHAALTYDMTFLAVLLSDLYDDPVRPCCERCPLRPWKKCRKQRNIHIDYAADMNVLLTYFNLLDDWKDEQDAGALLFARYLRKKVHQIREIWPRQYEATLHYIRALTRCEADGIRDLDYAAGLTGDLLGEIFVCEEDIWADRLRRTGFYLGKFIYLMDAWEDCREDQKKGSYNPWLLQPEGIPDPEETRRILTMMAGETAKSFEQLPVLEYAPILRNILYSGIWSRFEELLRDEVETNDRSLQSAGCKIRRHR